MNIYTGNYNNCKTGNLISISGDRGKKENFKGDFFSLLAPKKEFWKIWYDNIGILSEEENTTFYIENFYKHVLKNLNAEDILHELKKFGNEIILLCYEDSELFCHRHLVAAYLERKLGLEIPEIKIDDNGKIYTLKRNLKYINEFNKIIDCN